MRSLTYALAPLPGFASPKTYAAWPVWRDSTTKEVRFVPMSLKQAAKHWQKARRFDRQTHTKGKHAGLIGRTALAVLYALLFDFLDFDTGQLDPSYDTIAAKAGVCRRAVAMALARLKDLGLLHWQRHSRPEPEAGGGYRQVQITRRTGERCDFAVSAVHRDPSGASCKHGADLDGEPGDERDRSRCFAPVQKVLRGRPGRRPANHAQEARNPRRFPRS